MTKDEWHTVSIHHRPALKVGDVKFYECPVTAITPKTWEILSIVNECTDSEGNILNLPFAGSLTDQPQWFRKAVKMVKEERSKRQRDRLDNGKKNKV